MNHGVTVTYYHSVGQHTRSRPHSRLCIHQDLFGAQVHRLHRRGYRMVDLQDCYDYMTGRREQQGPEVVLTFDDGFLDNWVTVLPMAREMGFKFTVFVNPDFVDPRDVVRATTDQDASVLEQETNWWGYLSWPELREMERSGLVDIQSHTMSHTWHFSGPTIVDFHHPGDGYPWLIWNAHPETMPYWLHGLDETLVPYGTPVYEFGRSIAVRRYLPDAHLDEDLAAFVQAEGGPAFFQEENWRERLGERAEGYRASHADQGRFESDAEHEQRIRHEVVDSKRILEEKLNKEIRFVCWPGGGQTDLAREIALQAGHLATTKGTVPNRRGLGDATHIFRVAPWSEMSVPAWLKWWVFDGQFERGRGERTLRAGLADTVSSLRRRLRRKRK